MTAAAAWPVCTICYEDLRPLSDQHICCLPSCGHVFHALCLEQWLEYCPGGKKKGTCPICKHPCGAAHLPTRLFFQSTGACPTQACPSSQDASEGADPEELARLEQKAASLGRVVEEQRDGIKKLNAEVVRWREQAATAEVMREAARKEKECVQMLLNGKTEELTRKTAECGRLLEKTLALAKELAALKLSSDMNLPEEEILKLASLGNHGNLENVVDVLKRSLAIRNKSYKELMIQCNILGRSESRMQQRLEKTKELVKRLKTRVQELEKELEEKGNSLLRDLRSSKKFKADQTKSWNITTNSGFRSPNSGYGNEATKLDEVMEDPCSGKSQADHLKHEGMCDLKAEGNLAKKDVIDLDADDFVFRNEHKTEISAKLFHTSGNTLDSQNKSGICQNDNRQSAAFECNTTFAAKETSFVNHTDSIGKSTFQENFTTELHILQENPISGTTKMSSSTLTREKETLTIGGISKQGSRLSSGIGPQKFRHFSPFSDDDWAAIRGMKGNHKQSDDDFETPGIFGADKTRKSIGSWCKGSTATGSASTNTNRGNLIAVGPDGRGGKVKILRDLGGRFQDSKSQALWPKAPKAGGKGGQSQIDHFFGKK